MAYVRNTADSHSKLRRSALSGSLYFRSSRGIHTWACYFYCSVLAVLLSRLPWLIGDSLHTRHSMYRACEVALCESAAYSNLPDKPPLSGQIISLILKQSAFISYGAPHRNNYTRRHSVINLGFARIPP